MADIHPHGYWIGTEPGSPYAGHHFDEPLARSILEIIPVGSNVLDLGCGNGSYVKFLNEHARATKGIDGNPNTWQNENCVSRDITEELNLHKCTWESCDTSTKPLIFDWVLSLEVGEHIPAEFEDVFLDNCHRHNREGIILSWAIPGQGGTGHVNERPNLYIIDKVMRLGYEWNPLESAMLRDAAMAHWFKNTLMVFRKLNAANPA